MVGPLGFAAAGMAADAAVKSVTSPIPKHQNGPQPELWKLVGDAAAHILQHFETVQPRHEDVDIAHNFVAAQGGQDPLVTLVPNDDFDIANGATTTLRFKARSGFVAHITKVAVNRRENNQDMSDVTVKVYAQGRLVQRIFELDYVRPIMLDRDDELVIVVTNNSGAERNMHYHIQGWLRANKQV